MYFQLKYTVNWYLIPCEFISITGVSFILLWLIIKFGESVRIGKRLSITVKALNIICILMFILMICGDLSHAILTEYYKVPLTDSRFDNLRTTNDSLYFVSGLLLYSLLFNRLLIVFKETVYRISNNIKIIFVILIFLFLISAA
eukprot:58229_1